MRKLSKSQRKKLLLDLQGKDEMQITWRDMIEAVRRRRVEAARRQTEHANDIYG